MIDAPLIPHEYQIAAIEKVLAEPTRAALIASEMGAGKTLQATEIGLRAEWERALFIGIKDTFDSWAATVERQSEGRLQLHRIDATKKGRANWDAFMAGEPGWFFAGHQYITTQDYAYKPAVDEQGQPIWKTKKSTGELILKDGEPVQETERTHLKTYAKMKAPLDALVVDEVHVMAANRKAIGRRTLFHLMKKTDWKLFMSGTWHGNGVGNMWSPASLLWPEHVESSSVRWAKQYLAVEEVRGKGGKVLTSERGEPITRVVGERIPGEFASTLPCYVRDIPFEAAPPAKAVYVNLSTEQREQYDSLEQDLVTWVESKREGGIEPLVADLPIVLLQRLRTATLGTMSFNEEGEIGFAADCESTKLAALRGLLDHYGQQKVLVFTDSKRFAHVVARRMNAAGYRTEAWTGDATSKEREGIKARFMAPPTDPNATQYLVATIQAGSTGIDGWQRVCSKMVWLSEVEGNPTMMAQATARLWRPGKTEEFGPFEQVKIIARDTRDEGVFTSLKMKHMQIQRAMAVAA